MESTPFIRTVSAARAAIPGLVFYFLVAALSARSEGIQNTTVPLGGREKYAITPTTSQDQPDETSFSSDKSKVNSAPILYIFFCSDYLLRLFNICFRNDNLSYPV